MLVKDGWLRLSRNEVEKYRDTHTFLQVAEQRRDERRRRVLSYRDKWGGGERERDAKINAARALLPKKEGVVSLSRWPPSYRTIAHCETSSSSGIIS